MQLVYGLEVTLGTRQVPELEYNFLAVVKRERLVVYLLGYLVIFNL